VYIVVVHNRAQNSFDNFRSYLKMQLF